MNIARKHLAPSALIALMMLTACQGSGGFMGMGGSKPGPGSIHHEGGTWFPYITNAIDTAQAWLGWISGILFVLSLAVLAASFYVPTLPKKDAIIGFILSGACFLIQLFLRPILYLGMAVAVIMLIVWAWPTLVMAWNKYVRKPKVNALVKAGKVEEAMALAKKAEPDDQHKPDVMASLEARVKDAIFT